MSEKCRKCGSYGYCYFPHDCGRHPDHPAEYVSDHPPGHSTTYIDSEGDERCECGKWLEPGYYEMEDHLKTVVQDAVDLT